MTTDELKSTLAKYDTEYKNLGVTVYALLKDAETTEPFRLDIEHDALEGLKALFMNNLREIISDNDELTVLKLSSSDERRDAIYVYDLELPKELLTLETVITQGELPLLNINDVSLASIKALLIVIGNHIGQIVLYKTMAPINVFGRASFFLKKSKSRLKQLNDEFLRVSAGFQMLRVSNTLLVVDLSTLERSFGFHDVIKREAAVGLAAIERTQLVSNPEVLQDLIDDVKFARRLTKVAKSSPVLKSRISNADIVHFCSKYPSLAGRIRLNEAQDKILLDTKVSKELLLKLFMDDYLTSELTRLHYTSIAKDSVEELNPEKSA